MNPNQAPTQSEQQGPRYEMPGPTRMQRIALRASNVAMGGISGASPDQVFDKFVTEVGGYEYSPETRVREGGYKHEAGARKDSRMVANLWDDTTPAGVERNHYARQYNSSTDYDDDKGFTNIGTAVAKTIDGRRQTTEHRGVVTRARHNVARRLMKKATKGAVSYS